MGSRATEATSPAVPKFVPVGGGDGASGNAAGEGFRFRLCSYNILAQVYVKSSYFPHSPSPCLRWKARSQTILTVLKSFGADFLCLQELDEFDSFYKKNMETHGYLSAYIRRNGRKRDGCGIFYKPSSAELILKEEIEYNDLINFVHSGSDDGDNIKADLSRLTLSDDSSVEDLSESINPNDDLKDPNDPRVRLKRDCVGIMAAFRLNNSSHHLVIVANTHIYWDPEWADVKLAQAEYLLFRLSQFRRTVSSKFGCSPSVIVAGDFNSIPGDMVYQFIVSGNASTRLLPDSGPLIPLRSLYASVGGEPPFTNCTPDFTGTLDYIFFSSSSNLKPVGLLQIPGHESPEVAGGLPNYYHPSDHLPIGGDFEVSDI
uniref:Carbon catabolite repressor protein 4 4 n=2 Tax=Anthurium amnicola TaxID=1678845 RepID=A0A1D1XVK6_9ARAE